MNAADGGTLDTDRLLVRGVYMVTAGPREVLSVEVGSTLTTPLRSKAVRFPSQYFWNAKKPHHEPTPRRGSVTTASRRYPQVKRRGPTSRAHCFLRGPTWRIGPTPSTGGRILHTFIRRNEFAPYPRQRFSATFCSRAAFCRFPSTPMNGGSSSYWWDGWEWSGEWKNTPSPEPQPLDHT